MTVDTNERKARPALPEPTTRVKVSEKDELDVWVLGQGTPVVLVHGAMTRDLLLPLADQLTTMGYRLIHYGRRGHGGHGLPAEAADIRGQAEDLVSVLDALGIDQAHVAGHSFGAYIALEVATQAADRLLSATLFEPMFGQALSPLSRQVAQEFVEVTIPSVAQMYISGEADRAVRAFCDVTAGVPGAWDVIEPDLPEGARELAAVDLNTFFQVDGPAMASLRVDPATVKSVPTPIQCVNGVDSPSAFHESRDFLRDVLPGTKPVDIAGAGHYFPILKAAETAAAMDEWFRRQD